MKTIAILGSTGSIGRNALKVISCFPDRFKVVALAAGANIKLLTEQINEFHPALAACRDRGEYSGGVNGRTKLLFGQEAIEQVAGCGADIVVMAIGGSAALLPVLKCLEKSKRLALANKECLVMAGDIVMQRAKARGVEIIPIDSEHSAIFQCLKEEARGSLERIYLTGSGGPLWNTAKGDLEFVKPDFALQHPRWQMGKKISIDSATLINKGFEVIEANYLFGLAPDKIKVLIHPQAVVHSLVQFIDGSILAQLAAADMRIPIQYALTYPERMPAQFSRLDFSGMEQLSFHLPDSARFPCLDLAIAVAQQKGLAGAALNACNEECVSAFLSGRIRITDFARIIENVLSKLKNKPQPSLKEILDIDRWAREEISSQFTVDSSQLRVHS
jgi:1-deoxy-D-xylulose-5-phosphate reductoisomerase